MATPGIVGERHYVLAQEIRRTLAQYAELKDIIAMLGLEQLSPEDRNVVGRARRLERFLTQPFFTTEQFTGLKGKLVSLKDSLDGCERILHDEFKDYPESGLYMIGTIGEAKGKPKPVPPAVPAKPEAKPETEADPKPADKAKPAPKGEAKPDAPAGPKPASAAKPNGDPGATTEAQADAKPAVKAPAKATPESPPKAVAQPPPEPEPAADTHES
jgi:F-type H+-transporting ATPase subunit beta